MKKYGFTLAEVLVTLGLIGLVASMTTPALIVNIQNNTNAARLSSTVSILENTFTNMITKEDADNLFETEAWTNAIAGGNRREFAGIVSNYMASTGFKEFTNANDILEYYGAGKGPFGLTTTGSKESTVNRGLAGLFIQTNNNIANGNHTLELKNGAIVFLTINNEAGEHAEAEEAQIKSSGGGLYRLAANIWIDVNGANSPNTLGKDIFAFYLGENGKLYPLGGKDVALYDTPNSPSMWNEAGSRRRCLNNNIGDMGLGCTGRVVAEGYKINY